MAKFKRENSSGGVLYKLNGDSIQIVLIRRTTKKGEDVWCLPKGKIEENESQEDAALREVKEETGVEGRIVDNLGSINYWFYDSEDKTKIYKTVYFYLMEYTRGSFKDHDWEIEEARCSRKTVFYAQK